MWQILNVEPSFGVCTICRSHECGLVDGKHQWIHCEALDDSFENIVIGYKCAKLFAENLGISKEVVEKVVRVSPTDEQILHAIHKKLELKFDDLFSVPAPDSPSDSIKEVLQDPKPKPSPRNRTK